MALQLNRRRFRVSRSRGALVLCGGLSLLMANQARDFVPPASSCTDGRHELGQDNDAISRNVMGAVATLALSPAAASASLPPAPSGINVLPEQSQAAVVFALFAGLGILTTLVTGPGFRTLRSILPQGWFENWQRTWPLIGAFFLAAGIAHFTAADAFESIYPPQGTWGFWYLPGSASFHVAWTGVAEIAGGAGLFLGAILLWIFDLMGKEPPLLLRQISAAAALGLHVLTWVVTPANVFMYTHGAQMVGLTPGDQPIPIEFHAIRGALQVVLLSFLWGYFQFAWPTDPAARTVRD
eukprot:TRINITY_DN29620_c0_g1_i1.p1 TRINITY_DN29620_c0_g1~~TRINITY_DN29620_c0_g1_i1.p1  ORF type:complete len:296 (+),score=46.41 TRINITY_DN29620_c0_g1_i1:87-974(+)